MGLGLCFIRPFYSFPGLPKAQTPFCFVRCVIQSKIDKLAVSKGMSAVMPSLKRASFTPHSGGRRSLSSSFLGVKWEKILGLKPLETAPPTPGSSDSP